MALGSLHMGAVVVLLAVITALALLASTSAALKRGHMQPIGKHRPGPEDTIDEFNNSHPLSSETFYREYILKRRPVVIRGAALDMPAFKLWTDDYLISEFGKLELRLEEKVEGESNDNLPAGKFGIGRDTMENYLSGYQSPGSNGYIVGELPEPMYRDVDVIPCMACSNIYRKIQEVNFWLTSKGADSAIHRDAFDAINCLLNGTKEWFFMDTKYDNEVYFIHRMKYELGGLSLVNPRAVDLEEFPKFADVKYAYLTVNAGDCLFVPSGYHHQVKSRGAKNMAVSVLWSKTPRNVQVNTCSPGEETAKPLSDAGVFLPYPGTGNLLMGSMDIELYKTLAENATAENGNKFDVKAAAAVVWEMFAPGEGYPPRYHSVDHPELQEIAKQVFQKLNVNNKEWMTFADLDALPLQAWIDATFPVQPVDISNTYNFEYSVIERDIIDHGLAMHFRKKTSITRKEWIHVYTKVANGSEYFGLKIYDEINQESTERLSESTFQSRIKPVLARFEMADPRLEVGADEISLISERAEDDTRSDDAAEHQLPEGSVRVMPPFSASQAEAEHEAGAADERRPHGEL